MTNEMAQDPFLIEEYLTESEELLERMDQDMVLLEEHPQDAEILNRIFRALHTIKGTSGFLGFDAIVRLSHQAEEILNNLRRGEILVTAEITDALLKTRDQLGVMLHDVRQGGLQTYELDALITELALAQQACANATVAPSTPADTSPPPDIRVAAPPAVPVAPLKEIPAQIRIVEADAPAAPIPSTPVPSPAAEPAAAARADVTPKTADSQTHTLRVDVGKLDELVNLIGELVLERNRLNQISRDLASQHEDPRIVAEALSLSASRLQACT